MHAHLNLRAGYPSRSWGWEDGPRSFRLVAVAIATWQQVTPSVADAVEGSVSGRESERTGSPHGDAPHLRARLAAGGGHDCLRQIACLGAQDATELRTCGAGDWIGHLLVGPSALLKERLATRRPRTGQAGDKPAPSSEGLSPA